jgi:WD40-like Beta Propeller Repeat
MRGWLSVVAGFGAAILLAAVFVLAGTAEAAFPGGDGLLAVQPVMGPGIVLIRADGRGERRVCAAPTSSAPMCSLARPEWSPDGRTLVVDGTSSLYGSVSSVFFVIYPDGSCLDCQPVVGVDAAFTGNPTLITALWSKPSGAPTSWPGQLGGPAQQSPFVAEYGVDGLARKMLVKGAVSDPDWSSRGELALVRGGWIWVGSPGKLRRLAPGNAPSWSPDGKRIVFARRGWLLVGRPQRRSFRRLVRGTAAAWSPDGIWIAFIGNGHRLNVVRATGGRVRRVGAVAGRTVDWQPLPPQPAAGCATPPGSTVMARNDTALITAESGPSEQLGGQNPSAYIGCLQANGRERLLARYDIQTNNRSTSASDAVLGGTYAALDVSMVDFHYGDNGSKVELFDLRTGAKVPDRGGESVGCSGFGCTSSIDQLVLGSDAVSAAHTIVTNSGGGGCDCTVEQIVASDSTGVHTLDSATQPVTGPAALTNLTLAADTLTWGHNGIPRSAQLHP